MSEAAAEGFGAQIADDAEGVVETGLHAAEGIYQGATGNWDGAADSALSMSESALGVASLGITTAAEAGWDAIASETGLPSAHDGLNHLAQDAGDAIGDGLEHLVGDDQAHQSAVAFDDGDILGGLGHMAQGAADTIGDAVEQGVSDAGQAISDAASSVEQGAEELWDEVTQ
jgi:hypothetical protein